jgi:hypothetical protein
LEVGCLIDFGVDTEMVLQNLKYIAEIQDLTNRASRQDSSLQTLAWRFRPTLMQGSPRLVAELAQADPEAVGPEAVGLGRSVSSVRSWLPADGTVPTSGRRVLDARLQAVPVGIWGELYLTAGGLARGSLQAAATAECWLPDPDSEEPGARLYRTGQRARWLSGGGLETSGTQVANDSADDAAPESKPANSEMERQVAAIWQQILGSKTVGPEDRFFELGGHSLQLLETRELLRQHLDAPCELPELMANPTLRGLAGRLVRQQKKQAARQQSRQRASRQKRSFQRFRK